MKVVIRKMYRDGKRIYGELNLPDEFEGALPTLIRCHGFGSNLLGGKAYSEYLADRGIAVYDFDFIGGGWESRSDGSMLEMSVLTEAEDLRTVISGVLEMPEVDRDNLFLMGGSQGGYIASIVAPEYNGVIRGMVNLYPGFVIPSDAQKRMDREGYDPENIQVMGRRIGHVYNTDAVSFDGYEKASGYAGPVLMIHGDADEIVPISFSEKALEIYPDGDLMVIHGAGHGFEGKDFEMAARAIEDFIKEHTI